jgi:imidazolonepropionase-like amidohydrolase
MEKSMSEILFRNVTVLDCSGAEPFRGEVLVSGNRIQSVCRGQGIPANGALVVDCRNYFLMPGLVESHAHLGLDNSDDILALGALPPEEHTLLAMRNAKLYLDYGFTSLISAGAVKPRLDIVMRNAITANQIPGPRLIASTPWLTVTGGLIDMHLYHMRRDAIAMVVDGPENYRRVVRELIREGVDSVKLIVSGDTGIPYADSKQTVMSEAELAVIAEETHARGRRISAHARSAESIKRCIRHGVRLIYHATFADEEAFDLLEAHRDSLFVSPNIGFTVTHLADRKARGKEKERDIFEGELEAAYHSISVLRKRGVRLLGGGDYGFALTPHGLNAQDIEHYVKVFDMPPMEAIQTMTRFGGEAMGLAQPLGQVKEGFLADLLLVSANPLDDVTVLQDPANLVAIMKDGQFHKEPAASLVQMRAVSESMVHA